MWPAACITCNTCSYSWWSKERTVFWGWRMAVYHAWWSGKRHFFDGKYCKQSSAHPPIFFRVKWSMGSSALKSTERFVCSSHVKIQFSFFASFAWDTCLHCNGSCLFWPFSVKVPLSLWFKKVITPATRWLLVWLFFDHSKNSVSRQLAWRTRAPLVRCLCAMPENLKKGSLLIRNKSSN